MCNECTCIPAFEKDKKLLKLRVANSYIHSLEWSEGTYTLDSNQSWNYARQIFLAM